MLFKLKENEVNATIQSNTLEVENLLAKVADLQAENKRLKEYLQQLSSASTAAESALDQLKTAYLMLKKIDSSQMDTLKQEVDNLYLQIKTNEIKTTEQLNQSDSLTMENLAARKNKNQQSKSSSRNQKANKESKHNNEEIKAVEVEVLDPEPEKTSNYEAVMKLKQLIN